MEMEEDQGNEEEPAKKKSKREGPAKKKSKGEKLELTNDDYYSCAGDGEHRRCEERRLNHTGIRKTRAIEAWEWAQKLIGQEGDMTHKVHVFTALLKAHATDDHAETLAEKLGHLEDLADKVNDVAENLCPLAELADKVDDVTQNLGVVADKVDDVAQNLGGDKL